MMSQCIVTPGSEHLPRGHFPEGAHHSWKVLTNVTHHQCHGDDDGRQDHHNNDATLPPV